MDELKDLQIEFQLRTILEEAWGEIDHKYRYMLSRSGNELPEYIHTGFYNLSAYLQAAALQAEHLCRQAEAYRRSPRKDSGPFLDGENRIPYGWKNQEVNPTLALLGDEQVWSLFWATS